tara:strand:- start:6744 stop:7277 length:534 start_codon:yes stop_codon:yes gene_type:complete
MSQGDDDFQEWHDAAQAFESSLMILRKDKNGWVIGFSVHPDEAPRTLMDAPLGTRFRQVLFEIGDDERPVPVSQPNKIAELVDISKVKPDEVTLAGRMCRNSEFQDYIIDPGDYIYIDSSKEREDAAAKALRKYLSIDSRRELRHDSVARGRFREICELFRISQIEEIQDLTNQEPD